METNKIYNKKRFTKSKRHYKTKDIDNSKWITYNCDTCGKKVSDYKVEYKRSGEHHYCGRKCMAIGRSGDKCSFWRGGRPFEINKFLSLCCDGKQVYQHRLVMEKYLGRNLLSSEIVHHLDINPMNNSIENLHLFPNQSEHRLYHIFLEDCVKGVVNGL